MLSCLGVVASAAAASKGSCVVKYNVLKLEDPITSVLYHSLLK